jgi:hypothetical protein
MQDPPKFTQIGIFGLKTNHLATLRTSTESCPGQLTSRVNVFDEQKNDILQLAELYTCVLRLYFLFD